MATTTIAGVIGVPDSRRDTAATSSSANPTAASPQSTTPNLHVADIGRDRASGALAVRVHWIAG